MYATYNIFPWYFLVKRNESYVASALTPGPEPYILEMVQEISKVAQRQVKLLLSG